MISLNVGRAGLSTARQCIAQQCTRGGVDPKTVRRDHPPDNPEVREEMKAIAAVRRRFAYRRIGVLLERKGMIMTLLPGRVLRSNVPRRHKKLYRL